MDTLTQKTIQQLQNKNYEERFLNDNRPRFLLGVEFVEKEIRYKLVI